MSQRLKRLPAMWETWVLSLGWEDSLEKEMATHSSILAWRIPMDRGAWWAIVHRVTKSQTQLKWLSTHLLPPVPSLGASTAGPGHQRCYAVLSCSVVSDSF